jgi:hypothetical protein
LSRVCFSIFMAILFSDCAYAYSNANSAVSPEYRVASQMHQAEIARQMFCSEKAVKEKVLQRDLASFVSGCMITIEEAERAIRR